MKPACLKRNTKQGGVSDVTGHAVEIPEGPLETAVPAIARTAAP
jgi:hypothetical protein